MSRVWDGLTFLGVPLYCPAAEHLLPFKFKIQFNPTQVRDQMDHLVKEVDDLKILT